MAGCIINLFTLKIRTPEKFAVITLKFEQRSFIIRVMLLKDADSTLGAVWSGSALFAQAYLSQKLGSLRYAWGRAVLAGLIVKWATSWPNLFMPYENKKVAEQPAHPCSLIGAPDIRSLDCIILTGALSKTLTRFFSQVGWLESYLAT